METVSGVNNWKLVIRREAAGVTLLRAVTCDERAALPEELFGLPVTALGDHALAPTAGEAEGEAVQVTCGPVAADAEWNNRNLRELTLPPALRRVGDYALMNCVGLKTLRLWDGVTFWGGGALMNCRALDTFHLTRTGEQGESLAYFADELSRELDVTITEPDGQTVRLLFPEYMEVYEENCPAHHFDYNIYGAGYPYHHCFRQKKLTMKEYDGLWRSYLGMEHDDGAALRLAWWRLRDPVHGLSPGPRGRGGALAAGGAGPRGAAVPAGADGAHAGAAVRRLRPGPGGGRPGGAGDLAGGAAQALPLRPGQDL